MILKENTKMKVSNSSDVAKVLQAVLETESTVEQEKEHFWVLGLNTKNVVKFVDLVSLGILTNAVVHPRGFFRLAVMKGVNSIIAGHNHPSGDPAPSREDIALTTKLREAGEILGIRVLDHVIIGNGGVDYLSTQEKGYL